MTLATELGERVARFAYEDLPAEALHWARVAALDTVGVTLAGAHEECARIVAATAVAADAAGPALVLGGHRRVPPLDAALINGTAAHALDFDDCSNSMGGHPSAPILPALLGLAEARGKSGRDFVTAYVAGWETETRIARGVNFHHYEKGWHPTATLGVFGSAAACARLADLPAERIATALALAVSLASGVKANFGTMAKPFHVGHCARNGLLAALMAEQGFTASPDAFEHRQGFLMVFNGEGNFDAARILDGWAAPLDILKPGVALKQYPCCASTHPAVDAMLALVERHGLTPEKVEHVQSWTHPRRLNHTNRPDPKSALDAKFSVQYCLSRALMHGRLSIEHFEGDAFREPEARRVLALVDAAPHPEMRMESTDHFGGEVRITLRDGTTVSEKVDRPLGRGPEKPLPPERLRTKFEDCAGRVLTPRQTTRLREQLERLDELADMRELTASMIP